MLHKQRNLLVQGQHSLGWSPKFSVNARVCWMIQPANVLLHRRDRPSKGDRENPLKGEIIEYMEINGLANLLVQIDA